MSDLILNNCIITHANSKIVKSYDVRTGSKIYHTGVDIEASDLYSPCQGVCIFNGLIDHRPSCTVQYSQNICVRFTHLKEVLVDAGQLIEYDQKIGIADKYVHFEYLTSEKNYPNFRVFFNAEVSYYMYKHDPMLVLEGNVVFDNNHIAKEMEEEDFSKSYQFYADCVEAVTGTRPTNLSYFGLKRSDLFEDLR